MKTKIVVPLHATRPHASELEVDKRLNIAAFHLNDQINQRNHYQCLGYERHTHHAPAARILPAVETEMKQEAYSHQCKHFPVARQKLLQQFRMEGCKYLANHGHRSLKRGVSEEYPAEAYKMESQYHSKEFTYSSAAILFGPTQ